MYAFSSETTFRAYPAELRAGDRIEGTLGGRTTVIGPVVVSDALPGMVSVPTDLGYLYLPQDQRVRIIPV